MKLRELVICTLAAVSIVLSCTTIVLADRWSDGWDCGKANCKRGRQATCFLCCEQKCSGSANQAGCEMWCNREKRPNVGE